MKNHSFTPQKIETIRGVSCSLLRKLAVVSVAVLLAAGTAHGATLTWDASLTNPTAPTDGSNTWDTGTTAAWSNGASDINWVAGDAAVIGSNNGAAGTITVNGTESVGGLTLNAAGSGNYTFSGTGTIAMVTGFGLTVNSSATFSNTGGVTSGASGTTGEITFGTANQTLTFTAGNNTVLGSGTSSDAGIIGTSNAISTTSTVALTGGTTTLTGNGNNTITVNIGNASTQTDGLQISGTATLDLQTQGLAVGRSNGTAQGLITIGTGGTVTTTLASSGTQVTIGRGGPSTATGEILVNGGTLNLGSNITGNSGSALLVGRTGGTGTLQVTSGIVNVADAVLLSANNGTGTLELDGGTTTIGAIVFHGGNNSLAEGNGVTGTGTLNVKGGFLYLGGASVGENGSDAIEDRAQTGGVGSASGSTINLSGGTIGATAAWSSSMNMTLSNSNGGITFKTANSGGTANNITLTGIISGLGGFTQTGTGTLQVGNSSSVGALANTYSGKTTVSAGTLSLYSGGTGNVEVAANATLQLQLTTAIASTANLTLDSGSTSLVSLSYTDNSTGTDTINSLTVAGLAITTGTYTASQLNTLSSSTDFSGTGDLDILTTAAVPEPSTWALLLFGMLGGGVAVRARRQLSGLDS